MTTKLTMPVSTKELRPLIRRLLLQAPLIAKRLEVRHASNGDGVRFMRGKQQLELSLRPLQGPNNGLYLEVSAQIHGKDEHGTFLTGVSTTFLGLVAEQVLQLNPQAKPIPEHTNLGNYDTARQFGAWLLKELEADTKKRAASAKGTVRKNLKSAKLNF